jgi:hypothetical protein
MTLKSWAAAGASCLAIAALAAASANPASAAKNRYAGEITLGYSFSSLDTNIPGASDVDFDTFIGTGSIMYNLEGNWFAQANFAFQAASPDINGLNGIDFSVDTWTAGGTLFWRDPGQGMLGVDVGYESADVALKGDGLRAGIRGEWYPNDRWTLGGAVGWEEVDFDLIRADGIYANAQVKYYINDRASVSLNANYFEANLNQGIPFDTNQWSVGLEGEYLISRETPVSVYGGVRYGDFSVDNNPLDDPTQWTAYVGVKFRFGNEGDPLVGQDREGAVSPTTTGFVEPFQM